MSNKIVGYEKKNLKIRVTKEDNKFLVKEYDDETNLYSMSFAKLEDALEKFHELVDTLTRKDH